MFKNFIKKIDKAILNNAIQRWRWKKIDTKHESTMASELEYRFVVCHKKNQVDLLSTLCDKYGSDKGEVNPELHSFRSTHTYVDFYSRQFSHCRMNVRKIFECGIGTNDPKLASTMGINGKPGASLRVWRDYFPNARIYGADIDRNILFEEERIKTFYVDQTNEKSIQALWSEVAETDFDLIIDDGLHVFEAGISLFKHSVSKLSKTGIYVIEDVGLSALLQYMKFFSESDFKADFVSMFRPNTAIADNSLVVIRRHS